MQRISCNVIMDLLPSYVDGICSQESAELIKEHMAACEFCRKSLERMQKAELVAEETQQQQLTYMKKVKEYYIRKNVVCFGLLAGIVLIGILVLLYYYGDVPFTLYYITSPLLIAASYITLPAYEAGSKQSKSVNILTAVSILLIVYTIFLGGLCEYWGRSGNYPFFVPTYQLGPFLYWQLIAAALVEIAIFIIAGICLLRERTVSFFLFNSSITGICIALAFVAVLKRMSTPEAFVMTMTKSFAILLAEGAVLLLIRYGIEKRLKDTSL